MCGQEWLTAVTEYGEVLKPHLKTFTLPEFSSLHLLRSGTHTKEIGASWAHKGDTRFSASTQGIFDHPDRAKYDIPDSGWWAGEGYTRACDGKRWVWGLARGGMWMLAEVEYKGERGYKDRGMHVPVAITFKEVLPGEIVQVTKIHPYAILKLIHAAVGKWVDERYSLYCNAQRLKSQLDINQPFFEILYSQESK